MCISSCRQFTFMIVLTTKAYKLIVLLQASTIRVAYLSRQNFALCRSQNVGIAYGWDSFPRYYSLKTIFFVSPGTN